MSEGTVYAWLQRRPLLLDVPLAVVLALLGLVVLGEGHGIGWAVVGAANLALVWRRSRPALAFAVVSVSLALRVPRPPSRRTSVASSPSWDCAAS